MTVTLGACAKADAAEMAARQKMITDLRITFGLFLVEDDKLAHEEIESAAEQKTQEVTQDRFQRGILEPVKVDEQEVNSLHSHQFQQISADTGGIVAGQMPEEGADRPLGDAFLPDKEVRDAEVGDGGHLEGDGGRYPETSPVIAAKNVGAQQPVESQIDNGAHTAREDEHDEFREQFFPASLHK